MVKAELNCNHDFEFDLIVIELYKGWCSVQRERFRFVRKKEPEMKRKMRSEEVFVIDESRIQRQKRKRETEELVVLDDSQIQSNDPPKNRKIIQSNSADGGGGRVNSLVNSNKI